MAVTREYIEVTDKKPVIDGLPIVEGDVFDVDITQTTVRHELRCGLAPGHRPILARSSTGHIRGIRSSDIDKPSTVQSGTGQGPRLQPPAARRSIPRRCCVPGQKRYFSLGGARVGHEICYPPGGIRNHEWHL